MLKLTKWRENKYSLETDTSFTLISYSFSRHGRLPSIKFHITVSHSMKTWYLRFLSRIMNVFRFPLKTRIHINIDLKTWRWRTKIPLLYKMFESSTINFSSDRSSRFSFHFQKWFRIPHLFSIHITFRSQCILGNLQIRRNKIFIYI